MKQIILALIAFSCFHQLSAQELTLSGKVLDANTLTPIEFASVVVNDAESGDMITGTTTGVDGSFDLVIPSDDVVVEVSFLGMASRVIRTFHVVENRIDLDDVLLSADGELLNEVVVKGEKSQTVFKLDKRIFNVGADLSSTGASALELLNNVPSVTVNIEGQISLRGSAGVQILIDGKPSVMTSEGGNALGTITSDMIDRIEVITNPSAKYDAEGTSGIINIVMKKEEKEGVNGSVTVNTGMPNNHSIGISLNRRTQKFNLFSQLGYGYRTFPRESEFENIDKVNNAVLTSFGENDKNEEFYNIVIGADYHINRWNVITLSGNFAYENESEDGFTNYTRKVGNEINRQWVRNENTSATNPKWEYQLQYKRDWENNKDRSLLFSAMGSSFAKEKQSNFEVLTPTLPESQRAATDFSEYEYTFKLDYTHPLNDIVTLESGAQYVINDVSNDYSVEDQLLTGWVKNEAFTNIFEFDQKVLGLYTTLAYEKDDWGIKGGVRMENTDVRTLLVNDQQSNNSNYTDFFPSAHVSYKVSEGFSMQAGYSRRIYRPRLWDLNPFFSFRDNFNLSTGNPSLSPEYTHSYEVTSIHQFGKLSLNAGLYHRRTTDVIEDLTMAVDNVSLTMPENIGTNNSTGFELNSKITPVDWLTLSSDLNINYFDRQGTFDDQNFDFTGSQWSTRLTTKYKLPAGFTAELNGNYQSKVKTVQGERADNIFLDFGARKKIIKGKVVLSMSVRDVFASRVRNFTADQPTFYTSSRSQRGRFFSVGVSYGFGKGEAMEFSAQKRF